MNLESLIAEADPAAEAHLPGLDSPEAAAILRNIVCVAPFHHRRLRRGGLALAGCTTVAAAAVLIAALVPGSPTGSRADAATVLRTAIRAAASQPPLPALGPGQYYYQERISGGVCGMSLTTGLPGYSVSDARNGLVATYVTSGQDQSWTGADGSFEDRNTPQPGHFLTAQDQEKWQAQGSRPNLCISHPGEATVPAQPGGPRGSALPSDPATLGALIAAGRVSDGGQILPPGGGCPSQAGDVRKIIPPGDVCDVAAQFDIANNLMASPVAFWKIGPALYDILEGLPGVEVLEARTDSLGRSGTTIEDPETGYTYVLDPKTGALLEYLELAVPGNMLGTPPGTQLEAVTFGPVEVVDGKGSLPAAGGSPVPTPTSPKG